MVVVCIRIFILLSWFNFSIHQDCDNLYKRFSFKTLTDSGTNEIIERIAKLGPGVVPFVLQVMAKRIIELEEVSLDAARADDGIAESPRKFPLEMWVIKALGANAIPSLSRELIKQHGTGKKETGYKWVLGSLLLDATRKTQNPLGSLPLDSSKRLKFLLDGYAAIPNPPLEWKWTWEYVLLVLHLKRETQWFLEGVFPSPLGRPAPAYHESSPAVPLKHR